MRVIRTEMYFDESQVSGYEPYRSRPPRENSDGKNPGVAFLWIKGDEEDNFELAGSKLFRPLRNDRQGSGHIENDRIRGVLDLFIRDADEQGFLRIPLDELVENGAIVDFILEQPIVMERSPPFSIAFKGILDQKNSPMWIGTFIGAATAWDHPVLLFITVPGGIIIVSSALGIGSAMQSGLNKAVKNLLERRRP